MKILSFLLLLFFTAGYAQEPKAQRLTLQDAVRTAMEKNSDLRNARLEVDRADARVQEAWGYALPTVNLSSRYTRTLQKPVFFLPDFSDINSGRIVPVAIGSP